MTKDEASSNAKAAQSPTLALADQRSERLRMLRQILNAFVDVVEPAFGIFARKNRLIAVEIDGAELGFYRSGGTRVDFLGNGSTLDASAKRVLQRARAGEIELRLLPERVLRATIRVPAAGLEYVEHIVGSRLDRLTPWTVDKVLYGYAVGSSPAADGQFEVEVVATSREIGGWVIARLAAFDLVPSRLGSTADPLNAPLRIDLFRGQNDVRRRSRRRRIAASAMAGVAAMLIVYFASLAFAWQTEQDLLVLNQQLTRTRKELVSGTSNMSARDRDLALIAVKQAQKARVVLIDRLAAIIPGNTALEELDIQQGTLRIAGTSTRASTLIEILEAEGTVSDARFTAPVTRQEDGRDRFDITAVLSQPPASETP